MKNKTKQSGFTLLEILLVIAAIAVLAGIVIIAINPGKQVADTRNAQRRSDIATILRAVYQYSVDNVGQFPTSIPEGEDCAGMAAAEICKAGAANCGGLVDLSVLTVSQKYLSQIPADPSGAGYHIVKKPNGRIMVCAPGAEQGATIIVQN